MDKTDLLYEMVKDLKVGQEGMVKDLNEIKQDLSYHIRRTDLLENKLVWDWKKISLIFATLASACAAVYYIVKAVI